MSNQIYTSFLDIPPTEIRNFVLPSYGFEISEDTEGIETRRIITENGGHSEITVFYNHLNAEEVNLLITLYNERVPQGRGIGLPQGLLAYPDVLFQRYLEILGQVIFYFRTRPVITTNQVSGTYSVILELEAKTVSLVAPSEVTAILSPTVTLSVDSSVPFVQWVQLKGQELIFSNPNSTTTLATAVAGNITNVIGEITVRVFLIDNPDIFQDISVNARPVDTAKYLISSRNTFISEDPPDFAIPLPIQWDYTSKIGNEDFYDNESNAFDPFIARWRKPSFSTYLDRYEIEVWSGTEWVSRDVIPGDESPTYSLFNPEEVFRIVAVHSIPGSSEEIRASSGILFIDPPNATGDIITAADNFGIVNSRVNYIFEQDEDLDLTKIELSVDEDIWHYQLVAGNITYIIEDDENLDLVNGGSINVPEDLGYTSPSGNPYDYNAHLTTVLTYIVEVDFNMEGSVIG